jgi:hypothetical protein
VAHAWEEGEGATWVDGIIGDKLGKVLHTTFNLLAFGMGRRKRDGLIQENVTKSSHTTESLGIICDRSVRFISTTYEPNGSTCPLTAPLSGAPNHSLDGGPLSSRYIERWGPAAHVTRLTVRPSPHGHPYRSRVLALANGKLHHRSLKPPPPSPCLRRQVCPPPREKVKPRYPIPPGTDATPSRSTSTTMVSEPTGIVDLVLRKRNQK